MSESSAEVDFVDFGTVDEPLIAYVSVGHPELHLSLDRLRAENPTPLEVFLAVTTDQPIPESLVADHERLASEGRTDFEPRALEFSTSRTFSTVSNDCNVVNTSNVQSFSSWVDEFEVWAQYYYDLTNIWTDDNTDSGTTYYYVDASTSRAATACKAYNNTGNATTVLFRGQYIVPSGTWSNLYLAQLSDNFSSARMYSYGAGFLRYQMAISQPYPDPRAYVAYAHCQWGQDCSPP